MSEQLDSAAPDSSAALFDFLALVVADRKRGELRPLTDYQRLVPGFEAEIAVEYERIVSAAKSPAPGAPAQPTHIGRYRVLHEIGRGGQARVWLALDEKLRRHVALKVVTGSFGSVTPERRERLRREANAISRLDHPGICGAYEADLDGATPYLAMRYVPGETLGSRLAGARKRSASDASDLVRPTPPPTLRPRRAEEFSEFLRFFEKLARAVHAAHEAGLVHRDIKPSNVMVTPAGEPVILDFGLARDESSDEITLTHSDAIVGTPVYMAPEQLGLAPGEPDRRTDVYALGVTLYECLTLQRPFAAANFETLREAIRSGALADPSQHNPSTPADLRVVVATALERDPERRYASALALAEDLRRVREYEPILARPPSNWTRLVRWRQRHPTVAAALVLLLVGLALVLARERRRQSELRAETAKVVRALTDVQEANARLTSASLRDRAADEGPTNPLLGLVLARAAYAGEPSTRSSRALLDALKRPTQERVLTLAGASGDQSVDCAPRLSRMAVGEKSGCIELWDLGADERAAVLTVSATSVLSIDFSPDAAHLAYATEGGESGVVPLADDRARVEFEKQADKLLWIEFDPSGERVAIGSRDGTVCVRDARDGRELVSFSNAPDPVGIVRWNATGDRLITAAGNLTYEGLDMESQTTVRIWDARSRALVTELRGHTHAIRSVECSKDGRRVLTASTDRTARMWDAVTGEELWCAVAPGISGSRASFSPSEALVAFAYDPGFQLIDARTGAVLHTLSKSGERRVTDVDFSPDESRFVTVGQDGVARLFRTSDVECVAEFRGGVSLAYARFFGAQQRVACLGGSAVHVWDSNARSLPVTLAVDRAAGVQDELVAADLDAQGAFAVTASAEGSVRLWEVGDASAASTVLSSGARVVCASFDRVGERLGVVREDGSCEIRTGSSWGEMVVRSVPSAALACARFSPSGRLMCAGAKDGRVWLFDVDSDDGSWSLGEPAREVLSVVVSPDDQTLLVAHADGVVRVWNLPERTLEKTLRGSRDLPPSRIANVAMAFSRDAQRLAINFGESKRTEIFRRSDWEHPEGLNSAVLGTLGFTPRPNELVEVSKWNTGVELKAIDDSVARNVLQRGSWCFVDSDTSPDGRFLATCWSDPTALVFDLEQGSKSHELSGHARSVTCIRFSRDGRRLITASKDGTAIVWPVDVDAEAARRLPELTPPLLRILGLTQADLTPRVAQPAGSRE